MRSTRPRATLSRLTSKPAAAASRVGFARTCANAGDAVSRAIATGNVWAIKHESLFLIVNTSMSADFFPLAIGENLADIIRAAAEKNSLVGGAGGERGVREARQPRKHRFFSAVTATLRAMPGAQTSPAFLYSRKAGKRNSPLVTLDGSLHIRRSGARTLESCAPGSLCPRWCRGWRLRGKARRDWGGSGRSLHRSESGPTWIR